MDGRGNMYTSPGGSEQSTDTCNNSNNNWNRRDHDGPDSGGSNNDRSGPANNPPSTGNSPNPGGQSSSGGNSTKGSNPGGTTNSNSHTNKCKATVDKTPTQILPMNKSQVRRAKAIILGKCLSDSQALHNIPLLHSRTPDTTY